MINGFLFRSAKMVDKRMLMFTNEDDPFGTLKGVTKLDMTRTTLQRAKVRTLEISCTTIFF